MRIVVLFNLKPGVAVEAYEAWARATDMPGVRGMESVGDFQVYRNGLLGSDAKPPYAYSEVIDVADMDLFWQEVVQDKSQKIAAEFRTFLDDEPVFLATEAL